MVNGVIPGREPIKGRAAREFLAELRRHFAVSPDNPLMVLTQEEAKRFATSNARERYSMFLRATDMVTARSRMTNVMERLVRLQETIPKITEDVERKEASYKRAKKQYDNFMSIQKIDEELAEAKVDVAVAELEGKHKGLDELKEQLEQEKASLERAQSSHEDYRKREDANTEKISAVHEAIEKLNKLDEDRFKRLEELRNQIVKKKAPQKSIKSRINDAEKTAEYHKKQEHKLRKEMDSLRAR